MTIEDLQIAEAKGGVEFAVFAQPRASKSAVAGIHDGELKIQLTAPPVEGKANKALTAFLAKALNVPKGRVAVVSGESTRHKRVRVEGAKLEDIRQSLAALVK